jgi:hypothetical protein
MTERKRLAFFERQAEEAYSRMYDARGTSNAAACYSDAKEALYSAIAIARQLDDAATLGRLEARLDHVKSVFRSQFS